MDFLNILERMIILKEASRRHWLQLCRSSRADTPPRRVDAQTSGHEVASFFLGQLSKDVVLVQLVGGLLVHELDDILPKAAVCIEIALVGLCDSY